MRVKAQGGKPIQPEMTADLALDKLIKERHGDIYIATSLPQLPGNWFDDFGGNPIDSGRRLVVVARAPKADLVAQMKFLVGKFKSDPRNFGFRWHYYRCRVAPATEALKELNHARQSNT